MIAAWDHSVFSKNRDRLLEGDIAAKFLSAVLAQPKVKRLLSSDHFSVDGTLIEAWASMKSVKPRDGSDEPPAGGGRNAEADFHGQKRTNETHASTTDPDARLYRKGQGKEAKLCFMGHGLMENRHGLLVDACLTLADGHAERVAALHMIEPRADRPQAITLGADKAYDAEDFVNELRSMKVTPHMAQNTSGAVRRSMDARPGTAAMPSASASASASRRRLAGSRPSPGRRRLGSVASDRVGWAFTFAPPPTIWCGCRSSSRRPADGQGPAFAKAFAGRWRIVEMDVWDNDFLDLVEESASHIPGRGGRRDRLRCAEGLPRCPLRLPRWLCLRGVLLGRPR